tara:strand:- start:422 stop:1108 length:687 start_codon:yes stop_codon:yes gene_type:complete
MNFPNLQVSNFFNNPNEYYDFAQSIEFKQNKNGGYPGARSENLRELDLRKHQYFNSKIIRLLYPYNPVYELVKWSANTFFQKITYDDVALNVENKKHPGVGWVHDDGKFQLTAIVYLTKNDNGNSGTSVYRLKKEQYEPEIHRQIKRDYYMSKEVDKDIYSKELNNNVEYFDEVAKSYSHYNSLFLFDGSHHHAANFDMQPGEERLTLISFFELIVSPYFPIPEMKKL